MNNTEFLDFPTEKLEIYLEPDAVRYVLRLYVSGTTPQSAQAILNIKRICEEYLKDQYDLEVIDLYQQPSMTRQAQILAVPTLVKSFPLPLRKMIGNLADVERVLAGLDLPAKG